MAAERQMQREPGTEQGADGRDLQDNAVVTRVPIWGVPKGTKRLVREVSRINGGLSLLHMMGWPKGSCLMNRQASGAERDRQQTALRETLTQVNEDGRVVRAGGAEDEEWTLEPGLHGG